MDYFLITCDEDGINIVKMTERDLKQSINPDVDGEVEYGSGGFLKAIPEIDKGSWDAEDGAVLIIKGEIIVPKAVKTVSEWKV